MYEIVIKLHESKDRILSKTLYHIKIDKGPDGEYRGAMYAGMAGRIIDSCTIGKFDESLPPWLLLKLVLQRFKRIRGSSAGSSEIIQAPPTE